MTRPMPLAGVLVAAGRSRRMGLDKLWIDLWGRPAWRWSLDLLLALPGMDRCALVVADGAQEGFAAQLPPGAADRCALVAGGEERADSVLAGLRELREAGTEDERRVLVHDAARPAASAELAGRLLAALEAGSRAAIPALPVADSLRSVEGGAVTGALDRSGLVAVQTPQAALLGDLLAAHEAARAAGQASSDEAAALLAAGLEVRVVEGEVANVKLTTAADVDLVRSVLAARAAPFAPAVGAGEAARAGIGFDAHRYAAGRPLRLAGIDFPGEPFGLAGHSDGDAALHAVADALLGAARLGDIGSLFPPEDPAWEAADSGELLRDVASRVREAGWAPLGVDVTVAAERPRVAPRRDEMARRIAGLVGCPAEAVSVKGTTSDGLGFAGSEGVAAYAVALVARTGR